jgi:hypothetical protein
VRRPRMERIGLVFRSEEAKAARSARRRPRVQNGSEAPDPVPPGTSRTTLRPHGVLGAKPWARRRRRRRALALELGRREDGQEDQARVGGVVGGMHDTPGNMRDLLIDDGKIAAVGHRLDASGAEVVDASGMIVMPGFVDTHRHMWQGLLRNIGPDDLLTDYLANILAGFAPILTPDEVFLGDLISALSAINAGITTLLDWSHIATTTEHTDAAIEALQRSGVRAVYAYGANFGVTPPGTKTRTVRIRTTSTGSASNTSPRPTNCSRWRSRPPAPSSRTSTPPRSNGKSRATWVLASACMSGWARSGSKACCSNSPAASGSATTRHTSTPAP